MNKLQVSSLAVLSVILCYGESVHSESIISSQDDLKVNRSSGLHVDANPSSLDLGYPIADMSDENEDFFAFYEDSDEDAIADASELSVKEKEQLDKQMKQVVLQNLKGITLVGRPDDLNRREYDTQSGVHFYEVDVPGSEKALNEKLKPYIGTTVTLGDLNAIKKEIIMHFKMNGRPVVAVQIPEQDVTEGVVQVLVTEAKLGAINTIGNKHFKSSLLKKYIHLKPGKPINEKTLVENLNFMNRNPFRRTDAVYTPGEQPGTTNIDLITQDRRAARIYAGVDNTGIPKTGNNRWFAGFNWGNAWGLDHQLSYQYTTSSDFHEFQAHTANYTMPVPGVQHMLIFYGGYSKVHAKLPAPAMHANGRSYQASVRYDIPLPPSGTYIHEVIAGYDFKRTNNTVLFEEEISVFGKNCNLTQFVTTYNGGYQTRNNKLFVEAELYFSPFEWVGDQSKADYESLRPNADPVYAYGRISLVDVWYLPRNFSVSGTFRGQLASASLLPSEQFGIGGYNTVRGYDERQVNTDNGYILSFETRSPVFGIFKYVGSHKVKDGLQFLAFVDYGYGRDHDAVPGIPKNQYLISVGPGLRYNIDPYVAVRLDFGVKLHRHDFDGGATRLHFSVIASF